MQIRNNIIFFDVNRYWGEKNLKTGRGQRVFDMPSEIGKKHFLKVWAL